jgi:hypothetical protein
MSESMTATLPLPDPNGQLSERVWDETASPEERDTYLAQCAEALVVLQRRHADQLDQLPQGRDWGGELPYQIDKLASEAPPPLRSEVDADIEAWFNWRDCYDELVGQVACRRSEVGFYGSPVLLQGGLAE